MKLLITTYYLNNIGGTEIEVLNTVKYFSENSGFDEIEVFCPYLIDFNHSLVQQIEEYATVKTYPSFFKNNFLKRIDGKIKRTLKLQDSPLIYLYWFFKNKREIKAIYILTTNNSKYSYSILFNFRKRNCIVKYPTIYKNYLFSSDCEFLHYAKGHIVMNRNDQNFLSGSIETGKIEVIDVTIPNEIKLLTVKSNRTFTFGVLCRISREKRIEKSIYLVRDLKKKGLEPTLLIQGAGDSTYIKFLLGLISKFDLKAEINFNLNALKPECISSFYEKISFFLVTSEYEGGPITGLEAMASGVPPVSYNVGAMEERLKGFNLIVDNYEQLVTICSNLINLDNESYQKLSRKIRNRYTKKCGNHLKFKKLEKLLENEE